MSSVKLATNSNGAGDLTVTNELQVAETHTEREVEREKERQREKGRTDTLSLLQTLIGCN